MKPTNMTITKVNRMKQSAKEAYDEDVLGLCNSWKKFRELIRYAQHLPSCNLNGAVILTKRNGVDVGCDCGLDELRGKK